MSKSKAGKTIVEDFKLERAYRGGFEEFLGEMREWRAGGLIGEDTLLDVLVAAIEARCEEILKRGVTTIVDQEE